MSNRSRTEYTAVNAGYAMAAKILAILMGFANRVVFTHVLSENYVGVSGLFTGIINILSLSELGIGTALAFSLYRPIAEEDISKQKSLMDLYRKLYLGVAIAVLGIGLALMPFLSVIVGDTGDVQHLMLIYLIYLVNSAMSYLFIYRKALIDAHQMSYVGTVTQTVYLVIQNLLQIAVLLLTGKFLLYLLILLVCTLAYNITISEKAKKLYPYLNDKDIEPLDAEEKKGIKKNITAMMMHKASYVVINNTDNIIISCLIGVVAVGCYSNYYLIIGSVRQVLDQAFGGMLASIGNLGQEEDKKKVRSVFEQTFLLCHVLYGICAICLYELLNLFVEISFGEQYVFPRSIAFILALNFYLHGIRQATISFRDSLGLFRYDRYKAIAEAVLNLVLSVVLGFRLGVFGVFLGTTISMVLTSLWVEPYVLYTKYLKAPLWTYFVRLLYALFWTFAAGFWTEYAANALILHVGGPAFLWRLVCGLVIPTLVFLITESFLPEWKNLGETLRKLKQSRAKKKISGRPFYVEEEDLLILLRKHLTEDYSTTEIREPMKLMLLANKHKVLPFLYSTIEELSLEEYERSYLKKRCRNTVQQSYHLLILSHQIQTILSEGGVSNILLKGAGTASFYPVPELRKSGDVDLLLPEPEKLATARELLLSHGFSVKEEQVANHHLVMVSKEGIDIELHTMLAEPFDHEPLNQYMRELLPDIAAHTREITLIGLPLTILSDGYHAYELLLHMLQHFLRSGFGLKLLCDWVVFWNREIASEENALYTRLVEESGLTGFSQMISSVCYYYLGLHEKPDGLMDENLCRTFLKDILDAEEFGKSSKSRMVSLRGTKPSDYIREFHHQMKLNFPKYGHTVILWPALWVITLVRFMRNNRKLRGISGVDILKTAGDRSRVNEYLHLFQSENKEK